MELLTTLAAVALVALIAVLTFAALTAALFFAATFRVFCLLFRRWQPTTATKVGPITL